MDENGRTVVFCVGGAVQDFIFYVDEMPTQPIKYRAKEFMSHGGGVAATAAVAISKLGGKAYLASRLGDDDLSDLVLKEMADYGVDTTYMKQFEGHRTQISAIFIDGTGERQIVSYRDWAMPDGDSQLPSPLPADVDIVHGDTKWAPGVERIFARAKAEGKLRLLDGEPPFEGRENVLKLATHIVFSAEGLRRLTGMDKLEDGLRAVHNFSNAWVSATDGPNGVLHLNGDTIAHVPTPKVEVVDTLGAGDTWHGAFALALGEGQSEGEAICFANVAAGLKCTRRGGRAGVPSRVEVDTALTKLRARGELIAPEL